MEMVLVLKIPLCVVFAMLLERVHIPIGTRKLPPMILLRWLSSQGPKVSSGSDQWDVFLSPRVARRTCLVLFLLSLAFSRFVLLFFF